MGNPKPDAAVSVVVSRAVRDRLNRDAQMLGVSPKVLMAQVLTRYAEWEQFSREIGFASITRLFPRSVLEHVEDKTVSAIAGSTCRSSSRDAMLYVTGKADIFGLLKTIDYWLASTNVPFKHLKKRDNGCEFYVIQHQLGYKWSVYFSIVVGSILSETGYHAKDLAMDSESLSFMIANFNDDEEVVGVQENGNLK